MSSVTENRNSIPIVVGVTGHRQLRPQDEAALRESVKAQLLRLRALCPSSPLHMLTSLAEGGDLLCAEEADALGIPLLAALPCPPEDYQRDFSDAGRAKLNSFCEKAEAVFVAPAAEAVPAEGPGRDFLFRQAGIYVAAHSHVLLALWDGGEGTEAACGTAEAVGFALHGSYAPVSGMPLRSALNEGVIHVFTPRGARCETPAGAVELLGDWDAVRDVLAKTDEYNRLASDVDTGARTLVPERDFDDPVLRRMERVGLTAGRLSAFSAARFRRALALLAVAATLLTLGFLLYDEAQAIWMILVCGLVLLAAWLLHRYAARSDCHRRYIEYRVLAECMRVQVFLRYAGSGREASELLSWSQQEETAWIMAALCALTPGQRPAQAHEIRDCWAGEQRRYHARAAEKAERRTRVSERTVRIALILSVALYCAAVVFELLCGGAILAPTFAVADAEACRTVLKIVLGTISAVTLFVSNYYGRLSLSRTLSDHGKMERFFAKISAELGRRGQTEALLELLAREELTENGNWCSYQRDNKPEISL